MRLLRQPWLGRNPLVNGFWLAVLNGAIASACVATFMGILALVTLAENAGLPRSFPFPLLPFLYLLLLVLYAVVFLAAWAWFTRRLPAVGRGSAFVTALLGISPFLALAALGYADAVWQSMFGDFAKDSMLDVRIFLAALISTTILAAGLACATVVTLLVKTAPAGRDAGLS